MTLSHRIFVISPFAPNQFNPFYVLASQLEEAESLVETLGVTSFMVEDSPCVPDTQLLISTLEGRPPRTSTTKSVVLIISGHE